jgi:transcriptional regulator with XRE-family HTH domain
MPRAKTRQKPSDFGENKALVQVRKATNKKTQKEFAKAVGMNVSTLQKTEDGDRVLRKNEATEIMAFTGADPESLVEGIEATAIDGSPYSNEIFEQWRKRPVDADAVELAADRAALIVRSLVKASFGKSIGNDSTIGIHPARFRLFVTKLSKALSRLAVNHDLQDGLIDHFHELVLEETEQEIGLADIKKLIGIRHSGEGVKGWNAEAAAEVSEVTRFRVRVIRRPMLYPFAGASRIAGFGRVQTDAISLESLSVFVRLPWLPRKQTELQATVLTAFISDLKRTHRVEFAIPIRAEG